MRRLLFLLSALALSVSPLAAQKTTHVRGYTTKSGKYVAPHERSAPNHTKADNYGTKGNVNPYTGKVGTKSVAPLTTARPSPRVKQSGAQLGSKPKLAPMATPKGATAQCRDQTYSYSAHRRGTCSHHGGVATWLSAKR